MELHVHHEPDHEYRPQRFGEVAGQEAVKRILSRAAFEDRVAPAYLFSGTRGVGKTTLARVFAKVLNCERGPAAEPCNECLQCRQITAGISRTWWRSTRPPTVGGRGQAP
jgi:DNA polymerase-3 subunit gamma/tau